MQALRCRTIFDRIKSDALTFQFSEELLSVRSADVSFLSFQAISLFVTFSPFKRQEKIVTRHRMTVANYDYSKKFALNTFSHSSAINFAPATSGCTPSIR